MDLRHLPKSSGVSGCVQACRQFENVLIPFRFAALTCQAPAKNAFVLGRGMNSAAYRAAERDSLCLQRGMVKVEEAEKVALRVSGVTQNGFSWANVQ
jgi:hypothetical protein